MKYAQNHYSFDLWLTLIKSNPQFKIERAKFFHEKFNPLKTKTLEEVTEIIREIDLMCDQTNELTGDCILPEQMICFILTKLEYPINNLLTRDIQSIYHQLESLFFEYHPTLYDNDTKNVLLELMSGGATLSILSNTGFIGSQTMIKVLDDILDIGNLFSFHLFSDRMAASKPGERAFYTMKSNVDLYRRHRGPATRIIHIGDNPRADIEGAKKAGIESFFVHHVLANGNTLKHLLNF